MSNFSEIKNKLIFSVKKYYISFLFFYFIENPQQTKLIFQKLPVHMRRRVMSHNAKRLPRNLRNGHINQMKKSGLPPKTKKPSRKFRRRPQNLLHEYNRRQRDKFWLETHIWHAKRFKMIEKWGFKLPEHSNDRCFKANYRAVVNHCLIQDISYYTCIEIKGPTDLLKEKLKSHCNPNELTFNAKIYADGKREGTIMFYKKNAYPHHPIGHVHFLWREDNVNTKGIWIWVHPAFYDDVLTEIIENFNFQLEENTLDTESEASQEKIKSQSEKKVSPELKIFLTTKIPVYKNTQSCELLILRNRLNRFRLCGPLALSILTDALKVPKINQSFTNKLNGEKMLMDTEDESCEKKDLECKKNLWQMDVDVTDESENSIDAWFKTFYQSQENLEILKEQSSTFDKFRNLLSPNQLPPNMVLGLTVLDPRFFLPQKRNKSLPDSEVHESISMPPNLISKSPLWDAETLNYVIKNCMSTTVINSIRSQNLIPGVGNDEYFNEDRMNKIPILLIQKPGNYAHNNKVGFGSGIDIILPTNWSMPFWLAFILRCARPGGLRESKSIAFENSNFNMPAINHPDSKAYEIEARFQQEELTKKYFKLPPNKRTNYVKFGITSPFFCEWNLLMKEWTDADSFYVLRIREILSTLSSNMSASILQKKEITCEETEKYNSIVDLDNIVENKNCFVPVRVVVQGKGIPKDFAIICLPSKEDLTKLEENKKWSGSMESFKIDTNEEKRKTLRKNHLAHLKRLRRQRTRAKKKMNYAACDTAIETSSDVKHLNKIRQLVKKKLDDVNKSLIEQQSQTMENLYLPKCTNVRNSCDKEVIGYVTQGEFSFSEATGVGLGYVIYSAVIDLIKNKSNIVMVRNTTSRQYRVCKIEILD